MSINTWTIKGELFYPPKYSICIRLIQIKLLTQNPIKYPSMSYDELQKMTYFLAEDVYNEFSRSFVQRSYEFGRFLFV